MWTTDNFPFRTPLLAYILRGYFIEGRPKRDSLLIATLHRERRIPVALIVMATVLVQLDWKVLLVFCHLPVFRLAMLYKSLRQGIRWSMHSRQPTLSASEFSKFDFLFSFNLILMLLPVIDLSQKLWAIFSSRQLPTLNACGLTCMKQWCRFYLWICSSISSHSLPHFQVCWPPNYTITDIRLCCIESICLKAWRVWSTSRRWKW